MYESHPTARQHVGIQFGVPTYHVAPNNTPQKRSQQQPAAENLPWQSLIFQGEKGPQSTHLKKRQLGDAKCAE